MPCSLKAQERANLLKLNPFGFLGGQMQQSYNDYVGNETYTGFLSTQWQVAYERKISKSSGVQLSAGYLHTKSSQTLGNNHYHGALNGFIIIPEYRYYIFHSAPTGLYAAAFLRFRKTVNEVTDHSADLATGGINVSRTETFKAAGGGLTLGCQWLLDKQKHLVMDVFCGPQYKSRVSSRTYKDPKGDDSEFSSKFIDARVEDRAGFGIRFGFNIGWAF